MKLTSSEEQERIVDRSIFIAMTGLGPPQVVCTRHCHYQICTQQQLEALKQKEEFMKICRKNTPRSQSTRVMTKIKNGVD